LTAKKILEAKDAYYKALQANPKYYEIPRVREDMLKVINQPI